MRTFFVALTALYLLASTVSCSHGHHRKWKRMDLDSDGEISKSEFEKHHHKRFWQMDFNGDGKITFEEKKRWRKTKKGQLEIESRAVIYKAGTQTMKGFLAKPKGLERKAPGVLVIHEWWGQTDYPRRRAKKLAHMGFVALAVDMYGDGKTADHPKGAGEFAGAVMKDAKTVGGRFRAALKELKRDPNVNPSKIAAIGYCFGGSVVIEMAKQGEKLSGVVSFHGGLQTPSTARAGVIKAPLLVLNGEADPFVKPEQISKFKDDMEKAKADLTFVNYPGALHGFTNPGATERGKKHGLPLAYNAEVDQQSWRKMKLFFSRVFY